MLGPVSKIKLKQIIDKKDKNDASIVAKKKIDMIKVNEGKFYQQKDKFKKLNIDFLDLNFDLSGEIDESILRVEQALEDKKKLKYNHVINNSILNDKRDEKNKKETIEEIKAPETKIYTKIEIDNNNNVDNCKILSRILDFATTRPIECITDIETSIDIRYYVEPSKYITNEQLSDLCTDNPTIKYLDLSNCDRIMDYSPISKLLDLEELDLNNSDYLIDLTFLKPLKKLRVLNLGNTDVKFLDPLSDLTSLEVINLTSNSVNSIAPLKNCKNLRDIVLWGCLSIKNIDIVENFKELRLLDAEMCPISDLSCIKNLSYLNTLLLDNCNGIKEFSFLNNLVELKYLSIDGNTFISEKNLQFFSNLVNLEYLSLKGRSINKINFLFKCTKIKELILTDNMITDLSPLTEMTEMLKINLSKNRELKDLNPLYKMTKLNKLDVSSFSGAIKVQGGEKVDVVSSMSIIDISVVKNFVNLTEFNGSSNSRLKDISYLIYCPKLEELHLRGCTQLENVDVIGTFSCLRVLDVSLNPRIRDLYCVSKLENLEIFNYNGTVVPTIKMVNILKRCTKLFSITGNNSSDFLVKFIVSSQKRVKLYKSRKKYKS